jgi:hypothetical protein
MKYFLKTYDPEKVHATNLNYRDGYDRAWDLCLEVQKVVRMVDEDGNVFAYFAPSDVAGAVDVEFTDDE